MTEFNNDIGYFEFDFSSIELADEALFLLNSGTKHQKHNREFWNWRFNENPFGKSYGWYARDLKTNRLASVLLWWPWKFRMGNEEKLCYQAINGKTDARFRLSGVFFHLNELSLKFFSEMDVLLYGFPNENSYPSYSKLNWKTVTDIHPDYYCVSPIRTVAGMFGLSKSDHQKQFDLPQDWNYSSWNQSTGYVRTLWNAESFGWRFRKHPLHQYHYYFDQEKNLIVYRLKKRGIFKEAQIVFSDTVGEKFLKDFINKLKSENIDFFSYFGNHTNLQHILKKRMCRFSLKKSLKLVVNSKSFFKDMPLRFEMAEADSQ